jgi:hypothetical protein
MYNPPRSPDDYRRNTEEYARDHHVKAASVRVRLCREGHYFGTRPRKQPNGLLSWPSRNEERAMAEAADQASVSDPRPSEPVAGRRSRRRSAA